MFSWAIGRFLLGLKKEFESSRVNEPSGFEPLRLYCISKFTLAKVIALCIAFETRPHLLYVVDQSKTFVEIKGKDRGGLFLPCPEKRCPQTCAKCTDSDSFRARTKSYPSIWSLLLHSTGSNDSVSGQRRPWSDCADAQADLGLYWPCAYARRHFFAWSDPFIRQLSKYIADNTADLPSRI